MTTTELGKLERVDVRKVWPHEALNFTPWLAQNLGVLSEAVGVDLELVEMEATLPGEGGRVDILAKDLLTGASIVIENQLGISDNDHCAGLLGYAAHSDSRILIWVASGFTDWHRKIVKWLNKNGVQIYAVELSAWRIGDSYAPHLKSIAGPDASDNWVTSGRRSNGQRYRDFFQPLVDQFRREGITPRSTALAANDHEFPSGFSGIAYHAGFWGGFSSPSFDVYLWIATSDKDRNKAIFDALYQYKEEIERELPGVSWDRKDNQRMCSIYFSNRGSIEDSDENLAELQEWALVLLPNLKSAFQPRLEKVIMELQPDITPAKEAALAADDPEEAL